MTVLFFVRNFFSSYGICFDKYIISKIPTGAKWVIEVGCGNCTVARKLALKGYKVIATDIAIPNGSALYQHENIYLEEGDFNCPSFRSYLVSKYGKIDFLFGAFSLHHLSIEDVFRFIISPESKINSFLFIDFVSFCKKAREKWCINLLFLVSRSAWSLGNFISFNDTFIFWIKRIAFALSKAGRYHIDDDIMNGMPLTIQELSAIAEKHKLAEPVSIAPSVVSIGGKLK